MSSLRGLLARTLLLLAATACLNFLVDPFDVHDTRLLEPLVLGTRQTKLSFYRARLPRPEIVVLGSSRAFTVDPAYIQEKTGRPAFNAAVHAATPRDFLAFARCMAADGRFPATVVVALGLELFKGPSRPAESRDPLAACSTGPLQAALAWPREPPSFLTLGETWASLRVLRLEVTGRPQALYSPVEPDGMLRPRPTQPLGQALAESLAGPFGPQSMGGGSLHAAPLEEFRQFLELSREHGAHVVVYLAPFHPHALERYRAESGFDTLTRQLLEQLEAWARSYPLRSYDFTDIDSVGGAPDAFADACHPEAANDRRIVDALLPELRR